MGFTKSTADLNIISALSDLPNTDNGLTAEQLKAKFDEAGNQLQADLNNLVDELDGTSAATRLGATALYDGDETGDNVQSKLEHLQEEIEDATLGIIPDNTITKAKLEETFRDSIAEKNGNVQTGLNAEMLGGKKLPTLYATAKYHTPTHTFVSAPVQKNNIIPTMNSDSQDGFFISGSGTSGGNRRYLFSSTYTNRAAEAGQSTEYVLYTTGSSSYIQVESNKPIKPTTIKINGYETSSGTPRIYVSASNDNTNFEELGNTAFGSSLNDHTININTEKYYKYFKFESRSDSFIYLAKINIDGYYTITTDNNRLDLSLGFDSYESGQKISLDIPTTLDVGCETKLQLDGLGYKSIPSVTGEKKFIYDGTKFVEEWGVKGTYIGATAGVTVNCGFSPRKIVIRGQTGASSNSTHTIIWESGLLIKNGDSDYQSDEYIPNIVATSTGFKITNYYCRSNEEYEYIAYR